MARRKVVKRPNKGDVVVTKYGDCKVITVHNNGSILTVQTPVHGIERIERADNGHWTVATPIAWGGWNQGFYPSVRKAVKAAAEYLNDPDNPRIRGHNGTYRLWIVRHDSRPGWRLVNCGNRGPGIEAENQGFYGPFTPENIAAKLKEHKA